MLAEAKESAGARRELGDAERDDLLELGVEAFLAGLCFGGVRGVELEAMLGGVWPRTRLPSPTLEAGGEDMNDSDGDISGGGILRGRTGGILCGRCGVSGKAKISPAF